MNKFFFLLFVQILLWSFISIYSPITSFPVTISISLVFISIIYLISIWLLKNLNYKNITWIIFFSGVLIRVILFNSEPSDDVNRYMVEGKMLSAGANPYLTSPHEAFQKEIISKNMVENVNHPSMTSIYFPLQLRLHQFLSTIFYHPLTFKLFFLLIELLSFFILYKVLNYLNLPISNLYIFYLNPLLIKSIAIEAHLEIVYVFFFLLTCLVSYKNQERWSGFFLTLSLLSKPMLYFLVPKIFIKSSRFIILLSLCTVLGFCLSHQPLSYDIFKSLFLFAKDFEFNSFFYSIIPNNSFAKIVYQIIILIILISLSFHGIRTKNLLETSFKSILIFLLSLQTIHPWYLIILLPALTINKNIVIILWTLSSNLLLLNYTEINQSGLWYESKILKGILYLPIIYYLIYPSVYKIIYKDKKFSW